jgi:RHH-type transcriptional regulator, rel operon repressor / antitoxin RelB
LLLAVGTGSFQLVIVCHQLAAFRFKHLVFGIGKLCNACIAINSGGRMTISIRLPEDLNARLKTLADKTGRSKTFYVREAIATHLDEMEDLFLAEAVLKRVRSGKEPTFSSKQIKKTLAVK